MLKGKGEVGSQKKARKTDGEADDILPENIKQVILAVLQKRGSRFEGGRWLGGGVSIRSSK